MFLLKIIIVLIILINIIKKSISNNNILFLSLSEEDVERLDVLRTELGMNRSQYIRYVLSGQKKKLVPSMQYKDAIGKLSSIDLSLRVIALNESLAEEDRLAIYSELDAIKKIFGQVAFGQVDQKLSSEV